MTAEELDREVAQYDRELSTDDARPLTPAQRAQEVRARRKRGRPKVGRGAKRVLVTIERDLLRQSDQYAKQRGLTRAALISHALRVILSKAG
jgi:hypothetical protein